MLPARIPKQRNRTARWKSRAHCDFVRSHECIVPGCHDRPIEVSHVRIGSDAGMGRKPSDWFTVSCCKAHHAESHEIGELSFQKKYRIDLHELAAAFSRASPKWPEIRARQEAMNG